MYQDFKGWIFFEKDLLDVSSLRKTPKLELIYCQADIILDVHETKLMCFIHFSVDTETICNQDVLITRQNGQTETTSHFHVHLHFVHRKCGSIPGRNKRFFSSPKSPDRFWDTTSLLFQEYKGCSFPGRKAVECAVFHTPPSSAKVSNDRNCTSTLLNAFMKSR